MITHPIQGIGEVQRQVGNAPKVLDLNTGDLHVRITSGSQKGSASSDSTKRLIGR